MKAEATHFFHPCKKRPPSPRGAFSGFPAALYLFTATRRVLVSFCIILFGVSRRPAIQRTALSPGILYSDQHCVTQLLTESDEHGVRVVSIVVVVRAVQVDVDEIVDIVVIGRRRPHARGRIK